MSCFDKFDYWSLATLASSVRALSRPTSPGAKQLTNRAWRWIVAASMVGNHRKWLFNYDHSMFDNSILQKRLTGSYAISHRCTRT
jgi:hypothetical protein